MKHLPGKIRIKLAKLLAGVGVIVEPEDLWCQEGGYRHHNWDLARWGSYDAKYQGQDIHLCSWDTMTECVKRGISEPFKYDNWLTWEISRK